MLQSPFKLFNNPFGELRNQFGKWGDEVAMLQYSMVHRGLRFKMNVTN